VVRGLVRARMCALGLCRWRLRASFGGVRCWDGHGGGAGELRKDDGLRGCVGLLATMDLGQKVRLTRGPVYNGLLVYTLRLVL